MTKKDSEYPFQARTNGKHGERMKTPLEAVKKVVKDFEGPVRVELYERGSLLATIHGNGEEGVVEETKRLFASNKRRY